MPRILDQASYAPAQPGWYYGAGCFYGSDNVETLNIKIPNSSSAHVIEIVHTNPDLNRDGVVNMLDFAMLTARN